MAMVISLRGDCPFPAGVRLARARKWPRLPDRRSALKWSRQLLVCGGSVTLHQKSGHIKSRNFELDPSIEVVI